MIKFNCPNCSAAFEVADKLAGREARCAQCGYMMTVPSPTASASPATAAPPTAPAAPAPAAPAAAPPAEPAASAAPPAAPAAPVDQAATESLTVLQPDANVPQAPPVHAYAAPYPAYAPPPAYPYSGYPYAQASAAARWTLKPFRPPSRINKSAVLGSYIALGLVFTVLAIAGIAMMVIGEDQYDDELFAAGVVAAVAAGAAFIGALVVYLVILARMWGAIQAGPARTSPAAAVGMLFIPFFNFYWAFESHYGWAQDYNRFLASRNINAKPTSEGIALGVVLSWLGTALFSPAILAYFVLLILFLNQGCDAINVLAQVPADSPPTAA